MIKSTECSDPIKYLGINVTGQNVTLKKYWYLPEDLEININRFIKMAKIKNFTAGKNLCNQNACGAKTKLPLQNIT